MEASVKVHVRYSETDQMGVVYHGNYFPWFDLARFEILKKCGIDIKELEENGILMPVINVECKYKKSAKFDDDLIIEAKADTSFSNQLVVNFKVIREKDKAILAEAKTRSIFTNRKNQVIHKKIFKNVR
ncbi:MAG: acyl-CoA thioesterase [Halanaerobiales bacterium]|nr:acyl-CoA thioesterase [Halanaerobiales bacterium]